jgi:hypothetical protein
LHAVERNCTPDFFRVHRFSIQEMRLAMTATNCTILFVRTQMGWCHAKAACLNLLDWP